MRFLHQFVAFGGLGAVGQQAHAGGFQLIERTHEIAAQVSKFHQLGGAAVDGCARIHQACETALGGGQNGGYAGTHSPVGQKEADGTGKEGARIAGIDDADDVVVAAGFFQRQEH